MDIKLPGFLEPAGEIVGSLSRTVDELVKRFGKFVGFDFDMGGDDEALAGGFEFEDQTAEQVTKRGPVLELEFLVNGFEVFGEGLVLDFEDVVKHHLDESGE